MRVNRSTGLKGVHGRINLSDFEGVKRQDRPDFKQTTGCCEES